VVDDELPILGEQPATDLANTWYEHGAGVIDFLADARRARRWVALVGGSARGEDLHLLRQLRDAVRSMFVGACDGGRISARAVDVVNRHAAAACVHVALIVSASGSRASKLDFRGPGRFRAQLATSCIEVLTGPQAIRRCQGPGCRMLFVQDHGRRRFCWHGCSHRDRQNRYRRNRA
jgi:predicted RNA-binding Zn ribbon-like protein